MNSAKTSWTGASGVRYYYDIHPLQSDWSFGSASFIFARQLGEDLWSPILIGQTPDLAHTMESRDLKVWAKRGGATHLHVMKDKSEVTRHVITVDLLHHYEPPLNYQLTATF